MKAILKFTLVGLLAVIIAGITVIGVAYAQGDGPNYREGLAEILGLTQEELRDLIHQGKTMEELAEDAGVDLEVYREEMRQTRQFDLESRIKEALANGEITSDHAEWLLEGLARGFLEGPVIGFGERGSGNRPGMNGARMPGMRDGKPLFEQ